MFKKREPKKQTNPFANPIAVQARYNILSEKNLAKLEKQVNEFLAAGFKLAGGVNVYSAAGIAHIYNQAVYFPRQYK